ncbi:hypothetical protein FHX34_101848 [Actinoplanes teichomyceticus]|uniref:Uncharacterized protein n=1 Tax=Actinoplanes teichomyceticus TaxID=1867 RepID=A0A561WPU8_ACTTI|nr:hypothetical protein FHX34_101848 [Actinoplanes teichomyceticus]
MAGPFAAVGVRVAGPFAAVGVRVAGPFAAVGVRVAGWAGPSIGSPPPAPPAGGTGAGGGSEVFVGAVVGWVVVDSVGLVALTDGLAVLAAGVGRLLPRVLAGSLVADGVGVAVADRCRTGSRFARVTDSITGRRLGALDGLASGAGLGRGGTGSVLASLSSTPGSGSTALDLTGPPARLTLTSPP